MVLRMGRICVWFGQCDTQMQRLDTDRMCVPLSVRLNIPSQYSNIFGELILDRIATFVQLYQLYAVRMVMRYLCV